MSKSKRLKAYTPKRIMAQSGEFQYFMFWVRKYERMGFAPFDVIMMAGAMSASYAAQAA